MSESIERRSGWVDEALNAALAGLARSIGLEERNAERLRRLVTQLELYPAGSTISPAASTPTAKWLISGWGCEMRILPDARRQIFSFLFTGDVVSCPASHIQRPCTVMALTGVECVDVAQMLAAAGVRDRPAVLQAMRAAQSVNEERRYDHMVRLGQHSASERVVNLLLELRDRLLGLGLVAKNSFRIPLTQEHLADALGLSVVHINRTLKALRADGLVDVRLGRVTLLRPEELEEIRRLGAEKR